MNTTVIFTDGSSRGNPGPGGWGTVIVTGDKSQVGASEQAQAKSRNSADINVIELGGGEKHTTNNRMELMAAIEGLRRVASDKSQVEKNQGKIYGDVQIKIFSDSSYVINGITKWVHGWKRNNWQTQAKKDVLNVDLWRALDSAANEVGPRNISWEYVDGHIGIAGNERCDEIATGYADGDHVELYDGPLSTYSIVNILDVSHDASLLKAKKSASSKSKSGAKAYSYVSSVGGKIETHHSWAECEKRVKGVKGARFKKSFDANDEKSIIDDWSLGKKLQ